MIKIIALSSGDMIVADVNQNLSDENTIVANSVLQLVKYVTPDNQMSFLFHDYQMFAARPLKINQHAIISMNNVEKAIETTFENTCDVLEEDRKERIATFLDNMNAFKQSKSTGEMEDANDRLKGPRVGEVEEVNRPSADVFVINPGRDQMKN